MISFLGGFLLAVCIFALVTVVAVCKVAGNVDRMCIQEES